MWVRGPLLVAVGLALGLGLGGCASSGTAPHRLKPWEQPALPAAPMRIIEQRSAAAQSVHSEVVEVGFGDNQNGTELVLDVLAAANGKHAAYVSELWVAMMFKWRGQPVECRSRVYLADEVPRRAAAATPAAPNVSDEGDESDQPSPSYSTEVEGFTPKSLSYRATDLELFCTKHGVVHMVPRQARRVTEEFDASNSWKDAQTASGSWGTDTEIVYEDVCEKRPVTRDTTRYDYQEKLGFVPVNWPEIARRYADGVLVETAPACYRLEDSETVDAHHRVHARLYYRAGTDTVPMAPKSDILEHYPVNEGPGAHRK